MALGKRAWRWRKGAWRGAIVKVARGNTRFIVRESFGLSAKIAFRTVGSLGQVLIICFYVPVTVPAHLTHIYFYSPLCLL